MRAGLQLWSKCYKHHDILLQAPAHQLPGSFLHSYPTAHMLHSVTLFYRAVISLQNSDILGCWSSCWLPAITCATATVRLNGLPYLPLFASVGGRRVNTLPRCCRGLSAGTPYSRLSCGFPHCGSPHSRSPVWGFPGRRLRLRRLRARAAHARPLVQRRWSSNRRRARLAAAIGPAIAATACCRGRGRRGRLRGKRLVHVACVGSRTRRLFARALRGAHARRVPGLAEGKRGKQRGRLRQRAVARGREARAEVLQQLGPVRLRSTSIIASRPQLCQLWVSCPVCQSAKICNGHEDPWTVPQSKTEKRWHGSFARFPWQQGLAVDSEFSAPRRRSPPARGRPSR